MTQSETISLPDGGHLSFRIDGPEKAPWIVMSNSVLTGLSIWDRQVGPLATQFRVLRYDQRGHGGSSVPNGPMTFDEYGKDLQTLLDIQDVRRCIFVGLSMGVPTGLAALAKDSKRFAAFVAVDGVAKSAAGREAFWAERRETARSTGMAEIAQSTVPRWLPGEDGQLAASLKEMVAQTSIDGFAAATNALSSYDQTEALKLLDCPFLGIAGAEDGAMPEAMRRQFGHLENAGFVEISNAGHIPNYQRPDAFNEALAAFVNKYFLFEETS